MSCSLLFLLLLLLLDGGAVLGVVLAVLVVVLLVADSFSSEFIPPLLLLLLLELRDKLKGVLLLVPVVPVLLLSLEPLLRERMRCFIDQSVVEV